ncbi:hypothetical protein FJZ19_00190 [Candidatus Pacearchaeota archaeon]|nr:hypothetical protein [Candidatus Pacearchaeota archaeon]
MSLDKNLSEEDKKRIKDAVKELSRRYQQRDYKFDTPFPEHHLGDVYYIIICSDGHAIWGKDIKSMINRLKSKGYEEYQMLITTRGDEHHILLVA